MATQSIRARKNAEQQTPKAPAFTLVTVRELAGYKVGDTLSTDQHIAVYLRAVLNEGLKEKDYTKLADEQILTAAKRVSLEGLATPADIEDAIVGALIDLQSSLEEPLSDNTNPTVRPYVDSALEAAEMVDEDLEAAVMVGVEGREDWDGAPIVLVDNFNRIFGEAKDTEGNPVMAKWPDIGSRRRGKISKAGKVLDTIPTNMSAEEWMKSNVPVDYGLVRDTAAGKDVNYRWLDAFVDNFPHRKQANADLKLAKALANGDTINPDEIPEHVQRRIMTPDGKVSTRLAGTYRDNLQTQRTNYINRVDRAMRLLQRMHKIDDMFPNIEVDYAARYENPEVSIEECAKARNPILLYDIQWAARKDPKTGEVHKIMKRTARPKAITVGQFLGYSLDKARAMRKKAEDVTTADLVATVNRGRKQDGQSAVQPSGEAAKYPEFKDIIEFEYQLYNVANYTTAEGKNTLIRGRLMDNERGKEFAAALVKAHDAMGEYMTIARPLADAFLADQAAANAERKLGESQVKRDKAIKGENGNKEKAA